MTRDQRQRWDTAFAERIERTLDSAAPSLGELVALADHHYRAGHRREAYRWALRAADATEVTGGVTESVNLLRRALGLRASLPDEPETRRLLLERVRRVASAGGRYAEELDAVDDLVLEVDPDAEPLVMSELLVRRLHLRFLSGHSFLLPADAAEAVRLAEADPTSWQYALALAELTHALTWVQDPSVAGVGERALDVARQVEDSRALSFALTANAIVASDAGRPDDAARLTEEAFGAALRAEDWFAAVHAALWQANAAGVSSSRPPAEVLSACREQLTAAGAPQLYVGWISACEAHGRLALGEVTECSALLRQALGADSGPYADAMARLVAARLAALQGHTGDAETHLARVEELIASGSAFVALPYDAVKVEVVLAGGDPRRAYQLASSAARSAVRGRAPDDVRLAGAAGRSGPGGCGERRSGSRRRPGPDPRAGRRPAAGLSGRRGRSRDRGRPMAASDRGAYRLVCGRDRPGPWGFGQHRTVDRHRESLRRRRAPVGGALRHLSGGRGSARRRLREPARGG